MDPACSLETTTESLEILLAGGRADLVAVGRAFLAKPDLARHLEIGADLNVGDQSKFYDGTEGGYEAGYIDCPTTLDEVA